MSIVVKSLDKDKKTESCPNFPSGIWTSENLTGGLLEAMRDWLMSSQPAFPASPSQSQESKKGTKTKEICGRQLGMPYALFDQDTFSWKMCQVSLITNTSGKSMGTLPREGMTCDGRLYPLKMWGRPTLENDGGVLLPTPVEYDATPGGPNNHYKGLGHMAKHGGTWPTPKRPSGGGQMTRQTPGGGIRKLEDKVSQEIGQNTGQLNPNWVEWLMSWPISWSSLEPMKELIWLDWSVDPADMEKPEIWPSMTVGDIWESKKSVAQGMEKFHLNAFVKGRGINTGPIPRVATGIKDRVNRLKAIGNGQVPLCVAKALQILSKINTEK